MGDSTDPQETVGESDNRLSRRAWLGTVSAATLGALAGCGSETPSDDGTTSAGNPTTTNGGGTGTGTAQGQGEPVEPVLDNLMSTSTPPPDFNWNPFATGGSTGRTASFAFEIGAVLFSADGELRPMAYDSWNYDRENNVLTTTLRDDLGYWNGDSFTAHDVYVYDEMVRQQSPASSDFERIEETGEYTIDYHLKEPKNPDIYLNIQLMRVFLLGAPVWESWLEDYQEASSQSERESITEELTGFSISNQEFMDRGLGTGAYRLTEVTDTGVTLKRWDDHRNADDIPIETINRPNASTSSRADSMVTNDRIDWSSGPFQSQWEGAAPDYLQNLVKYPTKNNIKVLINWKNREYLQDRNVRRAMAAVINTQSAANAAGNGAPIPVRTGMDPASNENYLGDTVENFIDYDTTSVSADLADQFLERSGYSRQNGTVVDPDGNELEPMRFTVGNGGQWFIAGRVASEQLSQYGFPVEFNSIDRSTKLTTIQEEMGSWDLSTESHYAGGTSHPFSFFNYGSFWGWRLGPAGFAASAGLAEQIQTWLDEGEEYSPYNGKPLTPEIPTEIGAQTLDGETKEINIFELINEIQTPISEERTQEIIRDLSWAWNFHVPDIDVYNLIGGMWGDTKNFQWPQGEQEWVLTGSNNYGIFYSAQKGLVDYVYE